MNDNVISIFDRYNTQKTADLSDSLPIHEKEVYQPTEIEKGNRRALRLQINFSDGGIDICSYAQLANIFSAYPDYVNLIFRSGIVYMEGENLRSLLADFREERIRLVQPFDATKHKIPEKGVPVIHRIEWRSPDQVLGKSESK